MKNKEPFFSAPPPSSSKLHTTVTRKRLLEIYQDLPLPASKLSPYLKLNRYIVESDILLQVGGTDRRLLPREEVALDEPVNQATLANAGIPASSTNKVGRGVSRAGAGGARHSACRLVR